jgi:LacI family transcriptional regulator
MASSHKTPTLADVAHAAGVSTATVSRCLNTAATVSPKTRSRVMAAVEQLGYVPHFGARAMAAKRTNTIGAIIPTMENAIFARGLEAFQKKLRELGYNLLVSSSGYQPDLEAAQIKAMVARGADGLLLIGYERASETYDYLDKRGIPTLIAWAYRKDAKRPSIGFDNKTAMAELTQHVIGIGHRRIGVISGIVAGNDRAAERVYGIKQAARAQGLNPNDIHVIETRYEIEDGGAAFRQLMQASPQPSVIICGNDVLAAGALHQAREMGLRVPADISITGFDDIELASIVSPPLTTVHVPHRQMGQDAATELVQMIEGQSSGRSQQLQSSLVLRASLTAHLLNKA